MGITYKGIHNRDIPAVWRSTSRPILPTAKTSYEDVFGVDGSYDFSAVNTDGREHYEDRVFTGTLSVLGTDIEDMQDKLQKVVNWLSGGGYGYLVFDDMPGTNWWAKVETATIDEYKHYKVGVVTVGFRAKPFAVKAEVTLGDEIQLDTDVSLVSYDYTGHIDGFNSLTLSGIDDGHFYSRPRFEFKSNIHGESHDLSITLKNPVGEDKVFEVSFRPSPIRELLVVDFDTCEVSSGVSMSNGNFFELPPGAWEMTIESNLPVEVAIMYNYQYMYRVGD